MVNELWCYSRKTKTKQTKTKNRTAQNYGLNILNAEKEKPSCLFLKNKLRFYQLTLPRFIPVSEYSLTLLDRTLP